MQIRTRSSITQSLWVKMTQRYSFLGQSNTQNLGLELGFPKQIQEQLNKSRELNSPKKSLEDLAAKVAKDDDDDLLLAPSQGSAKQVTPKSDRFSFNAFDSKWDQQEVIAPQAQIDSKEARNLNSPTFHLGASGFQSVEGQEVSKQIDQGEIKLEKFDGEFGENNEDCGDSLSLGDSEDNQLMDELDVNAIKKDSLSEIKTDKAELGKDEPEDQGDEINIGLEENELDELKEEQGSPKKDTIDYLRPLEDVEGLESLDDAYGIQIEPIDCHLKPKQNLISDKEPNATIDAEVEILQPKTVQEIVPETTLVVGQVGVISEKVDATETTVAIPETLQSPERAGIEVESINLEEDLEQKSSKIFGEGTGPVEEFEEISPVKVDPQIENQSSPKEDDQEVKQNLEIETNQEKEDDEFESFEDEKINENFEANHIQQSEVKHSEDGEHGHENQSGSDHRQEEELHITPKDDPEAIEKPERQAEATNHEVEDNNSEKNEQTAVAAVSVDEKEQTKEKKNLEVEQNEKPAESVTENVTEEKNSPQKKDEIEQSPISESLDNKDIKPALNFTEAEPANQTSQIQEGGEVSLEVDEKNFATITTQDQTLLFESNVEEPEPKQE